jgi:hypothetical protein
LQIAAPGGRFTALFGTPIYQAAKTGGYLYRAHLRAEICQHPPDLPGVVSLVVLTAVRGTCAQD